MVKIKYYDGWKIRTKYITQEQYSNYMRYKKLKRILNEK